MALPKKYDFNDYDNYITDPNPTTSAEAQDYFRNMDMLVSALVDAYLWQPNTTYTKGDVVKSPSMPSGVEAVCVNDTNGKSSNIEPEWGSVGGENIADGTCFWKLRWQHWSKSVIPMENLGLEYATEKQVEQGINNTAVMTPLRTKQEMLNHSSKGIDIPVLTLVGSRTVADLRTALEEWLSSVNFSCNAVRFGAPLYFVEAWNNEDLTYNIPDASYWNVYSIGSYGTAENTHLLFVSYDAKNIYTVRRQGNVWGKIEKLATNNALSMPSRNVIQISVSDATSGSDYYTAPADGWISAEFVQSGSGNSCGLRVVDCELWSYIGTGLADVELHVPIAKGQQCEMRRYNCTIRVAKFIYAQSEV